MRRDGYRVARVLAHVTSEPAAAESRPVVVVAGMGPGTSRGVSERFSAEGFAVAMLAGTDGAVEARYRDFRKAQSDKTFPLPPIEG